MSEGLDRIRAELESARDLGFVGPSPLDAQLVHARYFAQTVQGLVLPGSSPPPDAGPPGPVGTGGLAPRLIDLGSGGGLPGLVLAELLPALEVTLLEAAERRAAFLAGAIARLALGDRVRVLHERAEVAGRMVRNRHTYSVVTARSFGAPGVTAECAAPFLGAGGWLVVAEPPDDHGGDRWPESGLAALGMGPATAVEGPRRFVVIPQMRGCDDRYPRRTGVPTKRPLF